jgi:hypothetical protein
MHYCILIPDIGELLGFGVAVADLVVFEMAHFSTL